MSKAPSLKQTEARARNWKISRLRGLYQQIAYDLPFNPVEIATMQRIIEEGLTRLGAKTEDSLRKERESRYDQGS